ncbi:YbaB/EbfC family nucleoid-associated protein [Nocardioides sp. TF02-7]|uniref:YbaB/EbfC family nucleoid-associated protein n=1 Tax=Nocardioides sp. TF02-7 TaxID=2917724 RepID=UPI001F0612CB|nr:YbaB/EbfC family nucleoid-associated protein [Nocardioides sp. TF02-7]UMG93943.1 YbaB/EbfC family nucleoid-associated protein [Nocardioides sp. TF02-7]
MSQNPFDALGGGGLDLNALMEQAQRMQEQLAAAQQQLADATVEGSVAGGAVTVTVNGTGELTGVTIKPEAVDTDALDDTLADLGDLVVAAYRDARAKADQMAGDALGPLAGGIPGLPGAGPGADPGSAPGKLGF